MPQRPSGWGLRHNGSSAWAAPQHRCPPNRRPLPASLPCLGAPSRPGFIARCCPSSPLLPHCAHPSLPCPLPPCPAQVARPRPDFIARCFPTTLTPVWGGDGMPQCEAQVPHQTLKTGMRSFPSGGAHGAVEPCARCALQSMSGTLLFGLLRCHRGSRLLLQQAAGLPGCASCGLPPMLNSPALQCTPHGVGRAWASCASGCWACCAALPAAQRAQRAWWAACCRWRQPAGLGSPACRTTGAACWLATPGVAWMEVGCTLGLPARGRRQAAHAA